MKPREKEAMRCQIVEVDELVVKLRDRSEVIFPTIPLRYHSFRAATVLLS